MDKNYKIVTANDCHQGVGLFLWNANSAVGFAVLELALSLPCALTAAGQCLQPSTEPHRTIWNRGLGEHWGLPRSSEQEQEPKAGTGRVWVAPTAWPGPNRERGWLSLGSRNERKRLAQHLHTPRTHGTGPGTELSAGITGREMQTAEHTVHTKDTLHIY